MKLVAATGNRDKLKEMREIFPDFDILSAEEAGFLGDVEETGETFLDNARLKAHAVAMATGFPALADDSGLCVDALGGAPGIYSARYSEKFAPADFVLHGKDRDGRNRAFLLEQMKDVSDRSAHFCCAVVLAYPDGREVSAEGRTYGHILLSERGENGFGYDRLFFSDDLKRAFGEAGEDEKNGVSHRGRALAALRSKLGV